MIICCLGDSLTEGDYGIKGKSGIANVQKESYPYFLAEMTGAEVRNFGKCGYRSTGFLAFYKAGNVRVSDADKVLIMLGTNGGQTPEGDSPDDVAYKELIALIQADAPQAEIYLITPPNATVNPEYSNCGYMPQVKAAQKFVRGLAAELGLKLIDLGSSPSFTPETESRMQPNDGLHFGREGYKTMAEEIKAAII
ncbi:MAG: SGNH/GDSL hydrolase family protein [Clostridia bacterium]|nr:SGNH/GDSL hydrolase family protein [Clostridia bacterium]